jgi:hypothetical protein
MLVAIVAVVGCAWLLWLNLMATYAVTFDGALTTFQKAVQLLIVWIVPFIGASLILHFALEHSPTAIPRRWLPWPFTRMIFGDPIKRYTDRDKDRPHTGGGAGTGPGSSHD